MFCILTPVNTLCGQKRKDEHSIRMASEMIANSAERHETVILVGWKHGLVINLGRSFLPGRLYIGRTVGQLIGDAKSLTAVAVEQS